MFFRIFGGLADPFSFPTGANALNGRISEQPCRDGKKKGKKQEAELINLSEELQRKFGTKVFPAEKEMKQKSKPTRHAKLSQQSLKMNFYKCF